MKTVMTPCMASIKTLLTIVTWLFLMVTPITIFAQNSKPQDYVVTSKNDTIYGKVAYIDEQGTVRKFYKKIRVKTLESKNQKIKRHKVRSFKKDGFIYEGFWLNQSTNAISLSNPIWNISEKRATYYFLKTRTRGVLSHYELEWIEQGESALQSFSLLKKETNSFFIRADQGVFGLKNKALHQFFADCPNLQEQLKQKQLKHVTDVVDFYNARCK